jgi:hypothetical protein
VSTFTLPTVDYHTAPTEQKLVDGLSYEALKQYNMIVRNEGEHRETTANS